LVGGHAVNIHGAVRGTMDDDLIQMKKDSGRAQNLLDIEVFEKIK